ncbi:hypothetical protein [Salinigranum rubrum]|uniref:hypothetical protein n=1 Tax=Salinigranum rubrum TaxID=755307 RepID=UPI0013A569B9|nr:hypothetical protein [Salinigranum rubrum]
MGETLSKRLGSGFESVPSLNILRNGRCLGWLSNETAEDGPGAFLDELREGRQTLYDLTRDYYHGEFADKNEFRGVITRFAHGLAGTALHVLEMAGFRVVRELVTPEFTRHYGEEGNAGNRRDLAKFIATSAAIQSRYGHFSTYRQLFESREDKQDQALRPDVDLADPFGSFCGGLVLSGDGVEGFADDLGDALSRPAERVEGAPEFAVDIPVRTGTTPEQTAEAVERMLDAKAIDSTDEAVAILHGLARSVFGVCEALSTLGTEEWRRRVHLDEVRVALSALDQGRLLAKGATPTQRAGLAALLAADEPVSQAELGRRGNFSSESWRNNRDVLVAAGLVRQTDDGRWRACLPFASERELAIEVERGTAPEDVVNDQDADDQEASVDATWQGLPWFVRDYSTRAGDLGRDRRRPTDVLFEIVLDVGADTPQNAPETEFMEAFYGPEPPGQDVVTAFLNADESGLAGIWPLIEAGCALRDDPEPAVARMGDRPAQRAISDGGFSE